MCGKSSTKEKFRPAEQDLDIYIQDMKGLGRGKGFRAENKRSALDDASIVGPVKERCLDLSDLLYTRKILNKDDLSRTNFFADAVSHKPENDTISAKTISATAPPELPPVSPPPPPEVVKPALLSWRPEDLKDPVVSQNLARQALSLLDYLHGRGILNLDELRSRPLFADTVTYLENMIRVDVRNQLSANVRSELQSILMQLRPKKTYATVGNQELILEQCSTLELKEYLDYLSSQPGYLSLLSLLTPYGDIRAELERRREESKRVAMLRPLIIGRIELKTFELLDKISRNSGKASNQIRWIGLLLISMSSSRES